MASGGAAGQLRATCLAPRPRRRTAPSTRAAPRRRRSAGPNLPSWPGHRTVRPGIQLPAISRIEGRVMTRFILRRLIEAVIVLAIMSFLIYGLINLMPGDPLDLMIASNPGYSAEDVARLRILYGLDQPMVVRYWHWLQAALTLDFGYSRVFA